MAISVIDLGTASGTAGSTVTISSVTVPAKSLIFVLAFENTTGANFGSLGDGASNSYSPINGQFPNNVTANGVVQTHYAFNVAALNNSTITYTKFTSGVFASIAILYATGILSTSNPLDPVFTVGISGSGTLMTVTSGSPASSGELVIGAVGWNAGAGDTFSQDVANGAYAFPPDVLITSGSSNGIGGGFLINSGISSVTYAPTLNNSRPWAAIIQAFSAAPVSQPDAVTLIGVGNY